MADDAGSGQLRRVMCPEVSNADREISTGSAFLLQKRRRGKNYDRRLCTKSLDQGGVVVSTTRGSGWVIFEMQTHPLPRMVLTWITSALRVRGDF